MKKTEYMKEVQDLPVGELEERARTLGQELMKLRFRKTTGQLEQSHRMQEARRSLARVQTILARRRAETKGAEQ